MIQNLKLKKNKIIYAGIMFLLAFLLFVMSACAAGLVPGPTGEDEDITADSSVEQVLPIKNGNFQYMTSNTGSYPRTAKDWTSSFEGISGDPAPSKDAKYGVVSTNTEDWESVEVLKDAKNPGVAVLGNNDNILMLSSETPTALKYRSASFSIAQNSFNKISFWVYTYDAVDNGADAGKNKPERKLTSYSGADAGVTVNITGFPQPLSLRDISTDGAWKQYSFYVAGSELNQFSVNLEFCIGYGYENSANVKNLAKGFAFIDAVELKYINYAEWKAVKNNGILVHEQENGEPVIIKEADHKNTTFEFAYDNNGFKYGANIWEPFEKTDIVAGAGRISPSLPNATECSYVPDNSVAAYGTAAEGLRTAPFYNAFNNAAPEEGYVDGRKIENIQGVYPFGTDRSMLFIQHNTPTSSSLALNDVGYDLFGKGKFYRVSMWVKTSNFTQGTGAGIYLVNKTKSMNWGTSSNWDYLNTAFTNINTFASNTIPVPTNPNITNNDIAKARNSNKNYMWENWKQYSIYIQSDLYEDYKMQLMFTLGKQDVNLEPGTPYTAGWAAFTNLECHEISRKEYNAVNSSENVVKKDLHLYAISTFSNGYFNEVAKNDDNLNTKPCAPSYFTELLANSALVANGNLGTVSDRSKTVAGVISSQYYGKPGFDLGFAPAPAYSDIWDGALRNAPGVINNTLMIHNTSLSAFGKMTSGMTLSANSYNKISVLVKTLGAAKANIYLVDLDQDQMELQADSSIDFKNYKKPLEFIAPAYGDRTDETKELLRFENISTVGVDINNKYTVESGEGNVLDYGDGWMQYSFYIAVGNKDKSYRLELWNGQRSWEKGVADESVYMSQGTVLFDDVRNISYDEKKWDLMLKAYKDTAKTDYALDDTKTLKYQLVDKLDGESQKDYDAFIKDKTIYKELEVYAVNKAKTTMFVNYTPIDYTTRTEAAAEDEEEPVDEGCSEFSANSLLFVSSLLIAIVLLFVLGAIVFRKAYAKFKLRRAKNTKKKSMYKKSKRHYGETDVTDDINSESDATDD